MSGLSSNQLLIWREELKRYSLPAPDDADAADAPSVASVSISEAKSGVVLRLLAKKDEQCLTVDLKINAVVARAIAAAIQAAGHDAGWLDRDGELVVAPEIEVPGH